MTNCKLLKGTVDAIGHWCPIEASMHHVSQFQVVCTSPGGVGERGLGHAWPVGQESSIWQSIRIGKGSIPLQVRVPFFGLDHVDRRGKNKVNLPG